MCRLLSTTSYSVPTIMHAVKVHMRRTTRAVPSRTRVVCAHGLHATTCLHFPTAPKVVPMSELSDYLNANLGDRVADDIVRTAAAKGHSIHRTVVYDYLRGDAPARPRPGTIEALAAGFGVDPRILRKLSGRPAGELGPYVPVDAAVSLTKQQRKAIDDLIIAIVNDSERGGTDGIMPEAGEKSVPPSDVTATRDMLTSAASTEENHGKAWRAYRDAQDEADMIDPDGPEMGA